MLSPLPSSKGGRGEKRRLQATPPPTPLWSITSFRTFSDGYSAFFQALLILKKKRKGGGGRGGRGREKPHSKRRGKVKPAFERHQDIPLPQLGKRAIYPVTHDGLPPPPCLCADPALPLFPRSPPSPTGCPILSRDGSRPCSSCRQIKGGHLHSPLAWALLLLLLLHNCSCAFFVCQA